MVRLLYACLEKLRQHVRHISPRCLEDTVGCLIGVWGLIGLGTADSCFNLLFGDFEWADFDFSNVYLQVT